jgi:hypothetical protein
MDLLWNVHWATPNVTFQPRSSTLVSVIPALLSNPRCLGVFHIARVLVAFEVLRI